MDRSELQRLLDAGDSYGLMVAAIRAWREKHHPDATAVAMYCWVDDSLPPIRITLPTSAAA